MVSPNGNFLNGNGTHMLDCPSDYEERPVIDVTPAYPPKAGKWDDDLAPITWNLAWLDGSEISHSVTVRADDVEQALEMVKPLVTGVRKAKELAKQKAATANPEQPETQEEKVVCKIHGVQMERRVSKRNGGHYHCHRLAGNDLCFGREKKA